MISLIAFEAVARHGSFLSASEELSLSQSTISYRIKHLEQTIGIQLFNRFTRKVELTDQGAEFQRSVRRLIRDLTNSIDKLVEKDRLTVRLSTFLAARWLSSRLSDWNSNTNNTQIELKHDFGNASVESDVNIIWTKNVLNQSPSTILFQTNMSPVCTPKIAAALKKPEDILKFPLLAAEKHMDPWPEWFAEADVAGSEHAEVVVMSDSNVRARAAVEGLGISLGNHLLEAELYEGKLVRIFDIEVVGPGFHVETHQNAPPMTFEFVAWLNRQGRDQNPQLLSR